MLPLLRCFFAHLLILQYPDHHQNLISSSLYYSGPIHKISSQSVHNFLSNVVHRQTDRQTDKLTNATKNITSFAKEVIIPSTTVLQSSQTVVVLLRDSYPHPVAFPSCIYFACTLKKKLNSLFTLSFKYHARVI